MIRILGTAALVLALAAGPARAIDLSGDIPTDLRRAVQLCARANVPDAWAARCATARSYWAARNTAVIAARAAAIATALAAEAAFIDAANATGP